MKLNTLIGIASTVVVGLTVSFGAPAAHAAAGKYKYSADGTKYYCVWKKTGTKVYYKSRRPDPKTGKTWYWKTRKECTKA